MSSCTTPQKKSKMGSRQSEARSPNKPDVPSDVQDALETSPMRIRRAVAMGYRRNGLSPTPNNSPSKQMAVLESPVKKDAAPAEGGVPQWLQKRKAAHEEQENVYPDASGQE
jgi:hypothetical protein